ncbi:ABC transporter ATP-binding protein [Anaerolentibacter hominis]|uniref:ABC transporter ATP-binding protein n=1 Tax=Anaerolentibacter hominis TaxID=3079009 RepID=UPI0031B83AE6
MGKILKFLKKYWAYVIIILVLLVIQAQGDLKLPSYTSNIVNIGIQQSGIENAAAEVIRAGELEKLKMFMSDEEIELISSHYKQLDRNELSEQDYKEYVKKYPKLADEPLYVRDTKDKEVIEELDKAFGMPMMLNLMMNSMASGQTQQTDSAFEIPVDLSQMDFSSREACYQLRQMVEQQYGDLSESMVSQMAVQFVKGEYAAIGIDVDNMQVHYLLNTGLKMLGFTLIIMVVSILVGFLAARVAAAVSRDLRSNVFKKVLTFSNQEMDQFSTASLITRSTNDIQQVQMVIFMLLRMVLYAPILGIGGVFKVINTNTYMAWIIAVAVAAIVCLVVILMAVAMPKFNKMQTLIDRLNLVAREILTGLPVIRAFSRERYEEKRFDTANKNLTKTMLFTNRVMTFMMPVMMLLLNGISVLILWVGANGVDVGKLQVGDIMAFMTYTMQIVMSFLMLTMISIMLPRAIVSAKRIDEILVTEDSIKDPANAKQPEAAKGVLTFDHVDFHYPNADENVLADINFTAEPGKTTAIIGSTGCGKSTLMNLIPRFYDVTGGRILLDGVDIRDMSQHDLRARLGYVPQKGVLFSGTIDSNLRYGWEDAPEEQVKKAASIAQATEFIESKPEGYESPISQGGTNVSGGQKQRLSIARAIAKNPQVYLFDDSFSALDYKTDVALRKALNEEVEDSTVIIVAQRISTILHADQIMVLDEGRIVGKGTHEELLRSCEEYQQIAHSQLSAEELGLDKEVTAHE